MIVWSGSGNWLMEVRGGEKGDRALSTLLRMMTAMITPWWVKAKESAKWDALNPDSSGLGHTAGAPLTGRPETSTPMNRGEKTWGAFFPPPVNQRAVRIQVPRGGL